MDVFIKIIFAYITSSAWAFSSFSQNDYPQTYFRSPIDFKISVPGNFGELRSTHFHAGIDFSGNGVEGKKIYAVADGYISRIRVSPTGYGNALYITHPNGYVSVYAHLQKFNKTIAAYVKKIQYDSLRFEQNLILDSFLFKINKGDVIGLMGNTGNSFGAHLHFEIRNQKSENPQNPLLFGFDVKDSLAPKIFSVAIFPLSDTSLINGKNEKLILKAIEKNGKFSIPDISPDLYGAIGFGIEAYDYMNGQKNKRGTYSVQLFLDNDLVYNHELKQISYSTSRNYYSFIDYEEKIKHNKYIQRSFIEPGNQNVIYKYAKNNGYLIFNDSKKHKLSYFVNDVAGNTAQINFSVNGKTPSKPIVLKKDSAYILMKFTKVNILETNDLKLIIDTGVLFDDVKFRYKKYPTEAGMYSAVHALHNGYVPLKDTIKISIKPEKLPAKLNNKAFIATYGKNKTFQYEGGKWEGEFITLETMHLGRFFIAIDTVKPEIKPLPNKPNESNKIKFKITDKLSDIDTFNGYVDGKWVLFEFDGKNDLIYYSFDEHITKGKKHKLELKVTDHCQNQAIFKTEFFY